MRKPLRADMPIALTLPLHFDLRIRARRRRRLTIAVLVALAAAVLAAGFWLPARAGLAPPTHAGVQRLGEAQHCDAALHEVVVGDELMLQQADGTPRIYEVTAVDVVDRTRVEFSPDDDRYVALTTCWPPAGATVGGEWQKVVTTRLRSSTQSLRGGL